MGRHSAPDADGQSADVAAQASATTLDLAQRNGRHARSDASFDDLPLPDDEAHTQRIAIIPAETEPSPTADTDQLAPLDLLEPTELPGPVEPPEPAELPVPPGAPEPVVPSRPDKPSKADKAAAKAEKAAARAAAKQAKGESGTRADLRMLRHNGAVRAQAIGAVIVSFLLYTVVLLVIGKTHDYLQWLFVPIVVAGIAVGLVLDLAHRRAANS
jgi:hypothetical protein